jgi:hypothetical protein
MEFENTTLCWGLIKTQEAIKIGARRVLQHYPNIKVKGMLKVTERSRPEQVWATLTLNLVR